MSTPGILDTFHDGGLGRSPGVRFALASVVIGSVLPITVFSAFLIYYHFDREQARISDAVQTRARAMVSLVDHEFATTRASLEALATHDSLHRGDIDTFNKRALTALPGMKADSIFVLDADGTMVMSTRLPAGITLPGAHSTQLSRQIQHSGRPGVSGLIVDEIINLPIVAVAIPMFRDNAVVGTLNASLRPMHFLTLIEQQRFPNNWRVIIVDGDGTVVARSHEMSRFVGQKVSAELLTRLSSKPEDAFPNETLDHVDVITVYSRSSGSHWSVAIGIPRVELTSALYHSLVLLIVAAIAAVAIGLALAWRVGGRIAGSITALADPARRIGRGGTTVDIPQLHFREARMLGSALRAAGENLAKARYEALHDALTGLPNRGHFRDVVDRELAAFRLVGRVFSVLVIDLDGFKAVNDTLGHAAGDELLREVARRLRATVRASDLPARLGGDEFAVCLPDTPLEGARRAAQKLVDVVAKPYAFSGTDVEVSASVGVASYPIVAGDADTLIKHADQALYRAKALGKNQVAVAER